MNDLVAANEQLDKQLAGLQPLADDPAQSAAATAAVEEMKRTATAANVAFATALLRDADARSQTVPANGQTPELRTTLADLRTSVEASASVTDPVQSLGAARDALAKSQAFGAALSTAYAQASRRTAEPLPEAPKTATVRPTTTTAAPSAPTPTAAAPAAAASSSSASASASKRGQLTSIVSSGRSMAKEVIRMGSGGTATQKANAQLAKNYDKYLANVGDSARGADSEREFEELIKKANQTKAYIVFLHRQSSQEE